MMDEKLFENNESFSSKLKTFDAFPKTRSHYTTRTTRGGLVTILLISACIWLTWFELGVYLDGIEEQHFTVEKAVGQRMQINIDISVAMPCSYLHINVQDAVGDRVLAGDVLKKQDHYISWDHLSSSGIYNTHQYSAKDDYSHENMWSQLHKSNKKKKSKNEYGKSSPLLNYLKQSTSSTSSPNSCRISGPLHINKVQGDFHITAKGHGYWDPGSHIDHSLFNFSHIIHQLSFGEYYPKLVNPLDNVLATTEDNFYKFQYFLSVVPTVYKDATSGKILDTNQYSVTEHSRQVPASAVPGVFFKFGIEPISLFVTDSRTPLLSFTVRLINIIGGVLVSGGWFYKLFDTVMGLLFKRQRRLGVSGSGGGEGMLNGRIYHGHFD